MDLVTLLKLSLYFTLFFWTTLSVVFKKSPDPCDLLSGEDCSFKGTIARLDFFGFRNSVYDFKIKSHKISSKVFDHTKGVILDTRGVARNFGMHLILNISWDHFEFLYHFSQYKLNRFQEIFLRQPRLVSEKKLQIVKLFIIGHKWSEIYNLCVILWNLFSWPMFHTIND